MSKKLYPKATNLNEDEQNFDDDNAAARLIYSNINKPEKRYETHN